MTLMNGRKQWMTMVTLLWILLVSDVVVKRLVRTHGVASFVVHPPSSLLVRTSNNSDKHPFHKCNPLLSETNDNNNEEEVVEVKSVLENGGRVTLVGSGPGDPDLLTVAAYRIVTDPNALIIVDRLVSQEIVDLIQGECKIARKLPGCANQAQEEIYTWVQQGLQAGKHVVRLKIGDPFVFGRGGEEVLKFRSFGVEPQIIPGVSAAFSAPLLGSIPVTHRGVSNQVVMCTGYGRDNTSPDLIQYHKEQTIVFLMAVGRLQELSHNLVTKANYPPLTPVAIVERAGCPNQRTLVGNLQTIASLAQQHNIQPPSTIIVGDVVHVLLSPTTNNHNHQQPKLVSGLIQNMTMTTIS